MSKVTYLEYRPGRWVKLVDGKAVGPATPEEVARWQKERAAQARIWEDVVQEATPAAPRPEPPPGARQRPEALADPSSIWQDVVSQVIGTPSRPDGTGTTRQPAQPPAATPKRVEDKPAMPLTIDEAIQSARRGRPIVVQDGRVATPAGQAPRPAVEAPPLLGPPALKPNAAAETAKPAAVPRQAAPSQPEMATLGPAPQVLPAVQPKAEPVRQAPPLPTPAVAATLPPAEALPTPRFERTPAARESPAVPPTAPEAPIMPQLTIQAAERQDQPARRRPAPKLQTEAPEDGPSMAAEAAPEMEPAAPVEKEQEAPEGEFLVVEPPPLGEAPESEEESVAEPEPMIKLPRLRRQKDSSEFRAPASSASPRGFGPSYLWIVAGPLDDLASTVRSALTRYQERFNEAAGAVLCHADDFPALESAGLPVDVRQGKSVPPRNLWIGPK